MELTNNPFKKVILLLALFVGGLIWFLVIFFIRLFFSNLNAKPAIINNAKEINFEGIQTINAC